MKMKISKIEMTSRGYPPVECLYVNAEEIVKDKYLSLNTLYCYLPLGSKVTIGQIIEVTVNFSLDKKLFS